MTAGAATLEQTVTPLQPGRTYFVSVAAFYRDSAAGSADAVEVTMPPPPPFTIASVNPSANAVALSWNETLRPTRYVVFRDNAEVGDAGVNRSYQDNGVKPNSSYNYRIDAVYDAVYTGEKGYKTVPPVIVSATATTTTTKATPPPVVGFADTHTHPFANLAAGGRLLSGEAFGPIEAALAPCDKVHGPLGGLDVIGSAYGERAGHKTGGYPDFAGWPHWNTLNHQQMYSDWIHRAYQGGLRLMVALAVNNSLLCSLFIEKSAPCDDMSAADLQIQAAKSMEAVIDLQSGGPGRGWFRIAYTPEQARQIISNGKLAVVLGIEVDKLFGCGKGECDANTVNTQLDIYYGKGVRHLFPVHLADNAFGGFALTGSTLFKLNSSAANPGGLTGPGVADEDCSASGFAKTCNTQGLTQLGAHLITSMMNKGMIIDIDHMGMHTTDTVLALTKLRHYPVLSGHTGFVGTALDGHSSEREKSDGWLAAIDSAGGMVSVGMSAEAAKTYTPSWRGAVANTCPGTTRTMAQSYLYAVDKMGGPDKAAVGLATDQFLTKFAAPRFGPHCPGEIPATKVAYPVATRAWGTLPASQAGTRTFDYNTEGLAHFGLLPELVQDLKNIGLTNRDLDPLFRSAEGYIRMWERAVASVPVP
ncbi:MAG: membrane dipeptidase [Gemmatimonadales bacterium]|nr:membrane dipeptidase [Gemmatimonadales bacterium]